MTEWQPIETAPKDGVSETISDLRRQLNEAIGLPRKFLRNPTGRSWADFCFARVESPKPPETAAK